METLVKHEFLRQITYFNLVTVISFESSKMFHQLNITSMLGLHVVKWFHVKCVIQINTVGLNLPIYNNQLFNVIKIIHP